MCPITLNSLSPGDDTVGRWLNNLPDSELIVNTGVAETVSNYLKQLSNMLNIFDAALNDMFKFYSPHDICCPPWMKEDAETM